MVMFHNLTEAMVIRMIVLDERGVEVTGNQELVPEGNLSKALVKTLPYLLSMMKIGLLRFRRPPRMLVEVEKVKTMIPKFHSSVQHPSLDQCAVAEILRSTQLCGDHRENSTVFVLLLPVVHHMVVRGSPGGSE